MTEEKADSNVVTLFGHKTFRQAMSKVDGWFNTATGLGTLRDKMRQSGFAKLGTLTPEQLEALYSQDDMAARACDVVPEEMLRQGFELKIESDDPKTAADQAADVLDFADSLGIVPKFTEAMVWGRVFGAGAILLGVDDGATVENQRLVEPLDIENISKFDHMNVLDRRYVHPLKFYSDPTAPKFGLPETYLITPQVTNSAGAAAATLGTIEIHETRMVVFGGVRTTITQRNENDGWEQSVLQRMQTTLTQFGISWDSLAHILQDCYQGVFKMRNLMTALASNEQGLIMQRLALMDQARGASRALVLDADGEEFERQTFNFLGIDKPYQLMMLRLAASARMPVSILMGQSPAGMDATGELDIRWFYDTVRSEQVNKLEPRLMYVLDLMMRTKSGPTGGKVPEAWAVQFPPLWQMTPKEEAEIRKMQAETDTLEIAAGMLSSDEAALSRHTIDGWSANTTIDREAREAMIALEADQAAMIADTPQLEEPEDEDEPLAAPQTTGLLEMAAGVQTGKLDLESTLAILLVSFPDIEEPEARKILGVPNSREPEPMPNMLPAGEADTEDPEADGEVPTPAEMGAENEADNDAGE